MTTIIIYGALAILFSRVGWGIPTLLMVAMTGYSIYAWIADPKRKIDQSIRTDAGRFGVRLPDDPLVCKKLRKLYGRYMRFVQQYPALAADYDNLMEKFWRRIQGFNKRSEFLGLIERLYREWPMPSQPGDEFEHTLETTMQSVRRWDRSYREASEA